MCDFCGFHFRSAHTVSNAMAPYSGQLCGEIVEVEEESKEEEVVSTLAGLVASSVATTGCGGAFAKLRAAGLL